MDDLSVLICRSVDYPATPEPGPTADEFFGGMTDGGIAEYLAEMDDEGPSEPPW